MAGVCFWLLLVVVCPEQPKPVVIDTYCQSTRFQSWHRNDTRKTKEQIDIHNTVRLARKCTP